jgi:hypothetical protein
VPFGGCRGRGKIRGDQGEKVAEYEIELLANLHRVAATHMEGGNSSSTVHLG